MRGLRVTLAASLVGAASLLSPIGQAPARATGYQLDTSFGGGGYVEVELDYDNHEYVRDLTVLDDGSLQFAGNALYSEGQSRSDFVVHLSATGAPDPAFGPEGARRFDRLEKPLEGLTDGDGSFITHRTADGREFLTRYRRPGEIDATFGTAGSVPFTCGCEGLTRAVRAQGDTGWFAVGSRGYADPGWLTHGYDWVVSRMTATGAPDTAFGSGGTVRTDFGGHDRPTAAALQADGKLVAAGFIGQDGMSTMAVARYTDGGLDPTFGGDGWATAAFGRGSSVDAMVVQPDGKIVVAGRVSGSKVNVALARFLPDGSLDPHFGAAGMVETNLDGDIMVGDAAVTPDGHLLVAGTKHGTGADAIRGVLLRYRPDGTLEPSFGTGGVVTAQFRGGATRLNSVAIDGDQVYVAGTAGSGRSWVVARYGPTPEPPSSTTTTTTTTTSTSSTTTTTRGTTLPTAPPTTTSTTAPDLTKSGPGDPGKAGRRSGYWMVGADGTVYRFGDASWYGNAAVGRAEAVDVEPSPSGNGYWVVDETGRIFAFGDAPWFGNVDGSGLRPGERVTSVSARHPEPGYLVFTSKGRVIAIGPDGQAERPGVGHLTLNGPVLDSVVTPSGQGYYMVASDGGIFTFGDAVFRGSMGDRKLNAPVQSLVPDADGDGYWLVASDGGIFAFRAEFKGSMGAIRLNRPVTGMVRAGTGYLMVGEDGGIFDFSGDPTSFKGSLGATPPPRPITSVALL
ncbi:MAG: hypothetical protein AB1679_30830 [Actinomycetota bacterium]|jgi:uncharacterized delta-60 repeat protein